MWRRGTKCDCKHDLFWNTWGNEIFIKIFHFLDFFALVLRRSAALSSATQHASEFGRKWATEYLSTRFPLLTLLCAGYRAKLIELQKNLHRLPSACNPQFPLETNDKIYFFICFSQRDNAGGRRRHHRTRMGHKLPLSVPPTATVPNPLYDPSELFMDALWLDRQIT